MPISTYAELKTSIADWLNRDDLTAAISSFVSLAEADLNRKVRDWRMERRSDATLDAQFTTLPSDWMETVRINLISPTARLDLASDGALAEMRFQRGDTTGQPTHYAHSAGSLELFPTPDTSYAAEMIYIARLPALSDTTTTNWMLAAAPDAYLYGSLLQAAPYLKDDSRVAVWGGLYAEGVNALNAASERAKFSGANLRLRKSGMAT